jgi:hypothetical protein
MNAASRCLVTPSQQEARNVRISTSCASRPRARNRRRPVEPRFLEQCRGDDANRARRASISGGHLRARQEPCTASPPARRTSASSGPTQEHRKKRTQPVPAKRREGGGAHKEPAHLATHPMLAAHGRTGAPVTHELGHSRARSLTSSVTHELGHSRARSLTSSVTHELCNVRIRDVE